MKCARCNHDSTYPQRSGRVCPGCGKPFAFEPREGDPLPDMAWKSAIDQVSSNGTVRFTRSNLHHAIARRMKPTDYTFFGYLFTGVALLLVVAAGIKSSLGFLVPAVGLLLWGVLILTGRRKGLSLEAVTFDRLYQRWVAVHGAPARLIEPRASASAPAPAVAQELESYSFDRAVICDRPETVDLLLGNDFHFENNCAVLTADGYPKHAFSIVRKMLRKNPRLEVFVLHDATVEGCVLAHRLKTDPEWFGGTGVRVYDVALRPAQAEKQPALVWNTSNHVDPHPALTEPEREWLSKHWMAVAVLTPEQVIKRLFRAINRMPEMADAAGAGGGGSGGSGGDAVILWTTDAHASDGGGDSFG